MNDLNELIGTKVLATIGEDYDGNEISIPAKVIDVNIDFYYFEEKQESIYITVNVEPIEDLPSGFDYEALMNIPINCIIKHN